jgi:hypothetical protein
MFVEVMGPHHLDLMLRARGGGTDVVIATFESAAEVPSLVTQLWAENSELLVLGIFVNETIVRLYRRGHEVLTITDATFPRIVEAIVESASRSSDAAGDSYDSPG